MTSSTSSEIKILPLGGLGEIGMNCMLIENGADAFIVDCGLHFTDLDHFGVQFGVPEFTWLRNLGSKLKGVILTHGHEDHIGALPYFFKAGLDVPLYASHFTSLMIRDKLKEFSLDTKVQINRIQSRVPFTIGSTEIEPISVNHSIIDAMALAIKTSMGRIIHTGDFRIDPNPFMGKTMDLEPFRQFGEEGVLLLMSDSTNVENHNHSRGENEVFTNLDHILAVSRGLSVVTLFSSNISRMTQLMTIAEKLDKKVVLMGRSMDHNFRLAEERQIVSQFRHLIVPVKEAANMPREQLILLSTGCQGEPHSALNRLAHAENPFFKLREGDTVLFSSKMIPGNEVPISRLINELFRQGADVIYDSVKTIHASGHATRPELKQMIEITQPKYFIPVHGEYRHLVHHARLAEECGLTPERILIAANNDQIVLTPSEIRVDGQFETHRILLQNRDGLELTRMMLKERRKLAESGSVVVMVAKEKGTGTFLGKPEVITPGVTPESMTEWMVDEVKRLVQEIMDDYQDAFESNDDLFDIQEEIRVEVRRFYHRNIGKKPPVISVVLEV